MESELCMLSCLTYHLDESDVLSLTHYLCWDGLIHTAALNGLITHCIENNPSLDLSFIPLETSNCSHEEPCTTRTHTDMTLFDPV